MRDEKEERKKQARSNKQTRQSNTACTVRGGHYCSVDTVVVGATEVTVCDQ